MLILLLIDYPIDCITTNKRGVLITRRYNRREQYEQSVAKSVNIYIPYYIIHKGFKHHHHSSHHLTCVMEQQRANAGDNGIITVTGKTNVCEIAVASVLALDFACPFIISL